MDTSLLKCFLTLADTQSFSEAAERLNITQSTVSHKIARLETLLGKQLFERTTRSCMLTSDGRELVEHATRVIRSIEEMEQSFKPDLLTGTLVVGVPDDHYLFVPLTEALKNFMLEKPRVGVEIRGGLSSDLMRDLRQRHIDLAVIRDVPATQDSDVLCIEKLVWITAPNWVPPQRWRRAARVSARPLRLSWRSARRTRAERNAMEVHRDVHEPAGRVRRGARRARGGGRHGRRHRERRPIRAGGRLPAAPSRLFPHHPLRRQATYPRRPRACTHHGRCTDGNET